MLLAHMSTPLAATCCFWLVLMTEASFETWTLTLLDDAAKEKGAVCLDGSASGYYIEPGTGSGKEKWMVHFQGGGWCTSLTDCAARSKSDLGSSKTYASDKESILASYDGGAHGLFSNDSTINPDFHNWNKVYARYCDGGSRAGDLATPAVVGNTSIYFRGGRILDALLDSLLSKGLSSASDFLVGGCSAGGLTVWLHLDYIRSRVPTTVQVKGVPQCGLFMDLPAYDGRPSYTPLYKTLFDIMGVNASRTMSTECLAKYKREQWRCFMAQYALPFVKTPFFAVNSFYDGWQWSHILRMPQTCQGDNFANCTADERASAHGFRDAIMGNLSAIPKASGYFMYSCVSHCDYLNHDAMWSTLSSGGVSLRSAFSAWYLKGANIRIAASSEEPNANPTCKSHFDWQAQYEPNAKPTSSGELLLTV